MLEVMKKPKRKDQGNTPQSKMERSLLRQLKKASDMDLNPYRRGFKNELVSVWGADFPEVSRLSLQALPFDGDGWLSGDTLYLLSDLAEGFGSGLLELQVPGNQALLLGINPSESEELRTSFLRDKVQRIKNVSPCSLWGPCLGERADYLHIMEDLSRELSPCLDPDFKLGISGCPRDCRNLIEVVDLLIVIDLDGDKFNLWLGGRKHPFKKIIIPRPLKSFSSQIQRDLTSFILSVHDRFQNERSHEESLPELALRLSDEDFKELFLAN